MPGLFTFLGCGTIATPTLSEPPTAAASPSMVLTPMKSSAFAKDKNSKDWYNDVVQINAGPPDSEGSLTFTIHKDILRHKSRFFADQFGKNQGKAVFDFPDEDPEAFRRVKVWLYDGDVMGREEYGAYSSQGVDKEERAAAEPDGATPASDEIGHLDPSSATLVADDREFSAMVEDEDDTQYIGGDELEEEFYATAPTQVAGSKRQRASAILSPRKKTHYLDVDVVGDSNEDESQAPGDKHTIPGSDFENGKEDQVEPETEEAPLACPLDTLTLTKICALAERLQISALRKNTLQLLAQRLGHDMETPLEALMYAFERTPSSEAPESGLLSLLISFVVLVCEAQELVEYHRVEGIPADLFMALIAGMVPLRVPRSIREVREIWAVHYGGLD